MIVLKLLCYVLFLDLFASPSLWLLLSLFFCCRHHSSAVFRSVFHGSIIRLRALGIIRDHWMKENRDIYRKMTRQIQTNNDLLTCTSYSVRTHLSLCVISLVVYLCVHIRVWSMIMIKCFGMRFADLDSFCHHRFSSQSMQCMVNEERLVYGKGQADICQDTDMQACKNHIYNDRSWWCRQGPVIIIICSRFYQRFIYICTTAIELNEQWWPSTYRHEIWCNRYYLLTLEKQTNKKWIYQFVCVCCDQRYECINAELCRPIVCIYFVFRLKLAKRPECSHPYFKVDSEQNSYRISMAKLLFFGYEIFRPIHYVRLSVYVFVPLYTFRLSPA